MARKTTRNCWDLGEKLDKLYEAFERRDDLADRVRSDAELADSELAGKATISAWRNGDQKGRARWQASPQHIAALGKLLTRVTDGRIDDKEACRLWTDARRPEFTRRLFNRDRMEIGSVLTARDPTLAVGRYSLGFGLGMVETNEQPVDGELVLKPGEPFELAVDTVPGRTLVVLGVGEGGWFLLAPAREYRGPVRSRSELVPEGKAGWRISRFSGPHRVKVIELAAESAPVERGRGDPMTLSPDQEDLLVEELTDPELRRDWRWGECTLFVEARAS